MTGRLQLLAVCAARALRLQAQDAGIPPDWETRRLLSDLVANAKKLEPLIQEVKLDTWQDQEAARAYQMQYQSAKESIGYLQWSTDRLAKEPARLSYALETR